MPARRTPTIDDFHRVRDISNLVASPDGKIAACVVSDIDETNDRRVSNVHLIDLENPDQTRQFTTAGGASPAFSPDGRLLAFTANKGAGTQVYVAPVTGGEAFDVTSGKGSAMGPVWSPDGKHIAFVRAVAEGEQPTTPVERNAPTVITHKLFKYDGYGLRDNRRRHIFIVEVETQAERQFTHGDWHDSAPTWSPNGKAIAFVSNRSAARWDESSQSSLWLQPLDKRKAERLTPAEGTVMNPRFSPDGRSIAYAGTLVASQSPHYKQVLITDVKRSGEPRVLLASDRITPSHINYSSSPLEWSTDGKAILFIAAERGAVPLWRVGVKSGRLTKVFGGEFQLDGFVQSGNSIIYTSTWSSSLPEVMQRQNNETLTISSFNNALRKELTLAPTKRLQYKGNDNLPLEMFVLMPPGFKRGKPSPLAINIHGGPHAMHPAVYNPLIFQIMAAAGYVVMLPNPRGSHSYGQKFQLGCVRDWGGGDYHDIMAGVDHLVDKGIADPAQLYIEGYSYGGIMTSWVIGQTQRFRAAVVGAPVTDMVSNFGTDDEPHFTIESMGGTPQEVPAAYRRQSSLTYVANVKTPVQLQHFEGDLRCPIGQSEQYYMALKFLGIETEFIRYPGGSHTGRTPSQYQDMLRRTLDWFARH